MLLRIERPVSLSASLLAGSWPALINRAPHSPSSWPGRRHAPGQARRNTSIPVERARMAKLISRRALGACCKIILPTCSSNKTRYCGHLALKVPAKRCEQACPSSIRITFSGALKSTSWPTRRLLLLDCLLTWPAYGRNAFTERCSLSDLLS